MRNILPFTRLFITLVCSGFSAALILISAVLISGQTFGQRASKKYLRGTPEWKREVKRLDKTKNEKPREENNFNQVE